MNNTNDEIRKYAKELQHHMMQIPFHNGYSQGIKTYKQSLSIPEWAKQICEDCYLSHYESETTNRFIVEALHIIIESRSTDFSRIEKTIKADFYMLHITKWLAESEHHIEYLIYAQETSVYHSAINIMNTQAGAKTKNSRIKLISQVLNKPTIIDILKNAQKIRKVEVAKIVIAGLNTTKGRSEGEAATT